VRGRSALDIISDCADDIIKSARQGCCADRRKACSYHEGFADGIERFTFAVFSPLPVAP
jgi:hypothetical protein